MTKKINIKIIKIKKIKKIIINLKIFDNQIKCKNKIIRICWIKNNKVIFNKINMSKLYKIISRKKKENYI